jgi:hypothetical protein
MVLLADVLWPFSGCVTDCDEESRGVVVVESSMASRRSTGMPPARLAVISSIRFSPLEQARLVPRAATAAGPVDDGHQLTAADAGMDGDELAGEVIPVQQGLGDEELGGGFEAVQALSLSAQPGGEHVG